MKIRTGFVSNSSSSSFIVDSGDYPNVMKLAEDMMKIRNEDWFDREKEIPLEKWMIKQFELIKKPPYKNKNHFITFNTCNYDTFIGKKPNGDYAVSTCNNHDWSSIRTKEYFGGSDSPGDPDIFLYGKEFWYIEHDLIGYKVPFLNDGEKSPIPGWENPGEAKIWEIYYCDKENHYCNRIIMNINNIMKVICPICLEKKYGNLDRFRPWKIKVKKGQSLKPLVSL